MTSHQPASDAGTRQEWPHSYLTQWETALEEFRAACRSPEPPTVRGLRDFLRPFPPDQQADMLVNLVDEHLQLSWEAGHGNTLPDYLAEFGKEFAEFASAAVVPAELVESEFLARHAAPGGDVPSLEEYGRRFPARSDVLELLQARHLDGQRYVKVRMLGRGGMGRVWLGYDRHLGRHVAIKEPDPALVGNETILRRLAAEARITAGLEHPGIVTLHEFREPDEDTPFYVMRLVRGRTLREAIHEYYGSARNKQRLAWNRLLLAFTAACNAVAYAHRRGILHRDLKPQNVVLGEYGEAVVLDWGLGKHLGSDAQVANPADQPEAGGGHGSRGDTPSGEQATEKSPSAGAGTFEYMAPEQRDGRADQRSDVFGLGAILYEMLTGKAPYESGSREEETAAPLSRVREVRYLPPRRLRPAAPRALEAICLKAMAVKPEDRYATAEALASEVERWLADEPVGAWREPWAARARRWARRNRTLATAAATAAILTVFVGVGAFFYAKQQASERRQAVEVGLRKVAELRQQSEWNAAQEVLVQTRSLLGEGGPTGLRHRLERESANLDLQRRLDGIRSRAASWSPRVPAREGLDGSRLKGATCVEGGFDYASADREYGRVFQEAGIATEGDNPAQVAAQMLDSAVKEQLLAALDDWARVTRDKDRRDWLLAVARKVDPNEQRDRLRNSALWDRPEELKKEMNQANVATLSLPLVVALGARLVGPEGYGVQLLRKAQLQHPDDFWLALVLGNVLREAGKTDEAVGLYRVAVALRHNTSAGWNNLGLALRDLGLALRDKSLMDEAVVCCEQAVEIDPKSPLAHNNLGIALQDEGRVDEAIGHYRAAIRLDPNFALPHNNLGNALADKGQLDEAIKEYYTAIEIDTNNATIYSNLVITLLDNSQVGDAIQWSQKAIEIDRTDAKAHFNLGVALHTKGQLDDAIEQFRSAIRFDSNDAMAHNNLAAALLAKSRVDEPHAKDLLDEAIKHCQQALILDPQLAMAHNNLGNALRAKGRLNEAIDEYRKAIHINPRDAGFRFNLGKALIVKGQVDEAKGPIDEAMRLRKMGSRRYAAAARAYAEALAANAELSRDPSNFIRYNAACCSALAGCGRGEDAAALDEKERARLRQQARDWLAADLAIWIKQADGDAKARELVQKTLQQWQSDPALTGIRDPEALAKLPDEKERDACRKLWAEVEAVRKKAAGRQ